MRDCRHCAHENADHLAYCSRCGRRLPALTSRTMAALAGPQRSSDPRLSATAAISHTVVAPSPDAEGNGRARSGSGRLRWAGDSIGYIYVYMRGKLDAGERRRRLGEERDGAQAMLGGAIRDLGSAILRDGVQHPELTGLLEAIGRAEA